MRVPSIFGGRLDPSISIGIDVTSNHAGVGAFWCMNCMIVERAASTNPLFVHVVFSSLHVKPSPYHASTRRGLIRPELAGALQLNSPTQRRNRTGKTGHQSQSPRERSTKKAV